jgi:hypothetical protein
VGGPSTPHDPESDTGGSLSTGKTSHFSPIFTSTIAFLDCVNNEAVLHRVKEGRNILHTISRRKANWIGHILRRNWLIKHIIERKILGTRRRGRRRMQLLDDLKETR